MDFTHISSPISSTAPRTQITTSTPSEDERAPPPPKIPDGTLRLRGGPIQDRRVTWGEDVIDNEELGRKKSKGEIDQARMHAVCFAGLCFWGLCRPWTQESFEPDRYLPTPLQHLYPALEESFLHSEAEGPKPFLAYYIVYPPNPVYSSHPTPTHDPRPPLPGPSSSIGVTLFGSTAHGREELHLHLRQSSMQFAL